MAYAPVTCLIETLEHLLRFPYLVITIKELQIEGCLSGGTAADYPITDDVLKKFMKNTETMLNISCTELSYGDIYHFMYPGIIRKVNNRFARTFGDRLYLELCSDCYDVVDYACFVPNLLFSCFKSEYGIRKIKYYFCERAAKIVVLCNSLESLLYSLKDFANKCNDYEEKLKYLEGLVIDVAYRTEDYIEELLFDSEIELKMMNFVNRVCNVDRRSLIGSVDIEKDVKNIVSKKNGVYNYLQRTIKEVDSICKKVRSTRVELKIPVTENLQMEKIQVKQPVTENLQILDNSIDDSSRHISSWKTEVVGLDDDLLSLLDRLTMVPSGLERLAIVGMGGIGKTTLARRLFEDPLITYHFYVRAWVTVSQVHRVRDMLLGLLNCLTQVREERYMKSNEQLAEDLYRSLKGKRYLVVMDDLWDTKAWDDVKRCFPDDKNGSRIVLTTRLTKVANYVNSKWSPHCMTLLDVEHSWKLLHEKVLGKEGCPLELVEIGKRIARKCQGLPLAIVVVAGLLSRIKKTSDCWNGIANSISAFLDTDPEQCMKVLALSYNHLPNCQKACFLYMGAFPEDCEIEAQKLINLWVAEGFLEKKQAEYTDEGDYRPFSERKPVILEQLAEDYLEDLIGRSLVLVGKRSFSGKIKTCHIHDVLRDFCLKEAHTERFMHVLKRDAEGLPADINNQRRLSFQSDFSSDFDSVPSMPLVRSFMCFTLCSGFVPDILFSHFGFKLLRVLDVIFLRFEHFPVEITKLVRLRYLALTATFELPESLSKLRNLQTLIIHGPWIYRESGVVPTLLLEYWNMPWLRHLSTSVVCYLIDPFVIEKDIRCPLAPKHLQNLSTIAFANCTKEIFSIMPRLKKLGICETKEDYSSDESSKCLSNLVYLHQLQELKCSFYRQSTKARKINGLDAFPSNLRKLTLSWSYIPWESMIIIARLPNLEVLKLKNYAFQGPEWEPFGEGFHQLKHLLIENNDLVHWKATSSNFPRLQHLALRSCKLLEEIPFGVGEIPTLLLIKLHYCSKSAEISAKEIQEQIEGVDVDIRSNA
ncbi:hypothetical protein ACH5RR_030040 [Cinchona calisaya]|uniref:Uncharacterized protein n=1 Tax=Cinchona calisaya TaxID=153742 RepID=A0ABD2YWK8_9GENT